MKTTTNKFKSMTKSCILVLSCFIATNAMAQTTGMDWFGFKGKVKEAKISSEGTLHSRYYFDEDGNVISPYKVYDETDKKTFEESFESLTKNGFKGTTDIYGSFTATLEKNRISKVFYNLPDDKESGKFNRTWTRTFTYDKDGLLIKLKEVYVYYIAEGMEYGGGISGLDEYSREVNRALDEHSQNVNSSLEEYQRDLLRNPLNYQQAANRAANRMNSSSANAANRINSAAGGVKMNAYANVKKKKYTITTNIDYSDYEFDEFGNWISRMASSEKGVVEENQNILYDSEFWSKYYWEKLEKEGNLRKIEAFALHPNCHKTYKELAVAYWNQHILKEVEQVDNNNIDSLCHVSQSPIIMPLQKDSALNMVREELYNKKIMPIRDFNAVREKKTMVYNKIPIFDQAYQKRIEARSMELFADSVRYLTDKALKELDGGDNTSAIETTKQITLIDKANQDAFEICHEARHRRIVEKEGNGTVKETDYKEFIETYPNSEYLKETQNNRALYASSLFGKETTNEELERVLALPTDEPTHNIVKKRYKKWMFKNNHGRFFHIGVGGEFAYGAANVATSGELTTRLGYTCHILNATIGVKYNYLTSSSQMFKSPKEAGNAYFDSHNLSIPVMLRLNFKHGYKGATYFGAGAELDVYTISSRLRDVEKIKDKKFADSKFRVTPRVALGGRVDWLEAELFATYELNNPFDVDYIKNYTMEDGQNIQTACKEKAYKKQIDGNKFFDKVRGGIALRIWF